MNIRFDIKLFALAIDPCVRLDSGVAQMKKPAELVYPLLDAANSRWFYFSSATRPFGMVNLKP